MIVDGGADCANLGKEIRAEAITVRSLNLSDTVDQVVGDRPTQLICISDIYLYVNIQIQKT